MRAIHNAHPPNDNPADRLAITRQEAVVLLSATALAIRVRDPETAGVELASELDAAVRRLAAFLEKPPPTS